MVQGAQYSAVRPTGMKKKKNRYAPIIQEQARQGLATKSVVAGKEQALQDEQWQFQQDTTNQDLAMQREQMDLAQEQAAFQKTMGYVNLGIGAVGTAFEVIDTISDWL